LRFVTASVKIFVMRSSGTPLAHIIITNWRFRKATWYLASWTDQLGDIGKKERAHPYDVEIFEVALELD